VAKRNKRDSFSRDHYAARKKDGTIKTSIVWIAGSNSAEGTDVRLLCLLCVLRRAGLSFRWNLPDVFPIVCDLETSTMRRPRPELGCYTTNRHWGKSVTVHATLQLSDVILSGNMW